MAIESKEVAWNVLGIPVRGTVTAPVEAGPHPAVVFLAGSGPTDRDWCSPLLRGKNGTAALLAALLAARGYVTLRYDKLGSGPNVKENLPKFSGKVSMQTFVEELSGAVGTILDESSVDGDRLFALSNSEGAIHAVNYQLQAKGRQFRGLVLTGAPGRTVGDVARGQLLEQMNFIHNAKGATGFMIRMVSRIKPLPDTDKTMEHYDEAISDFVAGREVHPDPTLPKGIKRLLQSVTSQTNQPFSRELWSYNLTDRIPDVVVPILTVIGKKDIQVDWRTDGEALEAATAGRAGASFAYPENANHLLKHESRPREKLNARYVGSHYNSSKARLDDESVASMINWLDAHAKLQG